MEILGVIEDVALPSEIHCKQCTSLDYSFNVPLWPKMCKKIQNLSKSGTATFMVENNSTEHRPVIVDMKISGDVQIT